MTFIRLVVVGFIALAVIYLSLSLYARSVRRENLENDYDAQPVDGLTRSAYVERGMVEYNKSVRPKLIGLVFVIPPIAVAVIVYLVNAN